MYSIECISLADRKPTELPRSAVVCLGNFDGVHIGHRALFETAKELRSRLGNETACAVLCFRAPSTDFLSSRTPSHLSTLEQKLEIFYEAGMDVAFLIDFPSIRHLSPDEFAIDVLRDTCHACAVVCGFNYRFGAGGRGTPEDLKRLLTVEVAVQDEITVDGETVSSTRIRRLLSEGNATEAARLLSRPYSIRAEVLHGKSLGQSWGFPTINQRFPKNMLVPRHGVYVTDCEIDGKHYRGITNVGTRPTVDSDAAVNCETYVLDFSEDVYGSLVTVSFLEYLRPEQKFESEDALREQIQKDVQAARSRPLPREGGI